MQVASRRDARRTCLWNETGLEAGSIAPEDTREIGLPTRPKVKLQRRRYGKGLEVGLTPNALGRRAINGG